MGALRLRTAQRMVDPEMGHKDGPGNVFKRPHDCHCVAVISEAVAVDRKSLRRHRGLQEMSLMEDPVRSPPLSFWLQHECLESFRWCLS